MKVKLAKLYIAKKFFTNFFYITAGFCVLIFFINFMDSLEKAKDSDAGLMVAIQMAFMKIPDFINDIAPSLVIITSIITFFGLSSKSEITILRISGFSLWQIIEPVAISAFILGIFWVMIFGPISAAMANKFNSIESKYIKKEIREAVEPESGIWLRQENLEKEGEELIIQAKKVYKENLELDYVSIWFFNSQKQYYKKIDAKKMTMKDHYWLLEDIIINDFNTLNKIEKTLTITTNLEAEFVKQTIVNNFQNVKLFHIFELPTLIQDLKSSGLNSVKFKVYMYSLISKPFLFAAMTLIACFFGLNHIRNNNTTIKIFLGIITGLGFYIISSIMNSFGSSGLIPVFASTWFIVVMTISVGVLLIYKKENI